MKRHDHVGLGVYIVALLGVGLLTACASGGGSSAAKAADTPPPASSPLAKVKLGSSDDEVRELLGDPEDTNAYSTGKSWIPYYYGSDTHRTDWFYKGQGRVVFSRNRYSGQLKVIRVIYDPGDAR